MFIRESSKGLAIGVTYCCLAAFASCVSRPAVLPSRSRPFRKERAWMVGWLACAIDWRDLYMRVPQCLASDSGLFS
jgi:hypothetical protein